MPDFHQVAMSLLNHRAEDKLTNAEIVIKQVFEQGRALGREEGADDWWMWQDAEMSSPDGLSDSIINPIPTSPQTSIERAFGKEQTKELADLWYEYAPGEETGLEGLIPQPAIALDEEAYQAFVNMLERPPRPTPGLKKLFKNKNPWKDVPDAKGSKD